jgi:hypothetical protein
MRALFAALLLALAVTAAQPARAADLVGLQYDGGVRAESVLIYDYRPGVLVRAWWLSPWHDRHYFPATGKRPRLGRLENLSAKSRPVKPAATFYRAWSTSELVFDDASRPRARAPERIPLRRDVPVKP